MLWFAALLLVPVSVWQPVQQTQCPAMDANLPTELAGWATPGMGKPSDLSKPLTTVTLDPKYASALPAGAKPGRIAVARFAVDKPGTYGIALDKPGWIDVIPDGSMEPLESTKHGHGPECSTIRKIVRFDLKPGTYQIVVSGLPEGNTVKLMLVKP